ncbi:hypothetical protein FAES_1562 [Fibrella aestuarina BUZ 2]|uniref:DUF2029 domain-containing protein n=1 Tax=Fibrella aestuarina BUZ 2 TaxID=1166018 RepID=I0K619_9BACT|nr:hypothetical protein [Fibrella aestuarina]CCG99572.1 hypothetical protein FAES_1562 [Fibrella aestuarina BUZ 2]
MISLDVTSLVKTIVAVLLAGAVLLVWWQRNQLIPLLTPHERAVRWLSLVGTRLLPFLIIYVILDQEPRSDVAFFYERAVPALEGKMVYRDFLSFHAPLFTYLTVLPLLIWNNARSIILLMAIMEFIILNATFQYARRRAKYDTGKALLRYVLYYLLPIPFIAIVLSSEEDIWFWGFGLLSLGLLAGGLKAETRAFAYRAGLLWGLSMIVIKFMLIVLIIPLFFLIRQRLWFVLGLLTIGLPTILILYGLMGDKFLMPIQHSSYPMAPNFASVLRPVLNSLFGTTTLTSLNWLGLLGTIGGGSWVAWRARHIGYERAFVPFFCFLFTLFMLLLPSSPGYYIFVQLAALTFFILDDQPDHWLRMAFLNVLLTVQPIIMIVYANNAQYTNLSMLSNPVFLADYVIQVIEVILLVWLTRLSYNRLMALQ